MLVTPSSFPSWEKPKADAVECVSSQYDSGLCFRADSRSFLLAVTGNAEDVKDLCILSVGGGILLAWPCPFVCGLSLSMDSGKGFGVGNWISSRSLSINTILPSLKSAMKVFSERGIHRIC